MTQLNREQKVAAVAELAERFGASDTFFATAFSGLSVAQMQDLRRRLRDEAVFTIVRNTLARRAAGDAGRDAVIEYLEGPTGIVWVTGDPALAAKALAEFAKASDDRITVKGGMLEGTPIGPQQVAILTSLPSREELLARLAGGLGAPLHGLGAIANPLNELAGTLSSLLGTFTRTLDAVRATKTA